MIEENVEELEETNKKEEVNKKGVDGAKSVLSKVSEKSKLIAEKVNDEEVKQKEDALVTCRYLFYSVLDKILIVLFLIFIVFGTYNVFSGSFSSLSYGFWARVIKEIELLIVITIGYFFCNWFYKCIVKSMLCVTKEQIYTEKYVPFIRWEHTIPLNKVTAINSYKLFWIFRAVVVHQYGKLPVVFWTWNAQEAKDKVEELLTHTNVKVNNQCETKNIINKGQYKYVGILGCVLVVVIALVGVIRLFAYIFSDERHMDGTYTYEKQSITLKKDGTCELNISSLSNVSNCEWEYDGDSRVVSIKYKYKFYSYTYDSSISVKYDSKTLTYNNNEYKK